MSLLNHQIELLSPAKNTDIARAAILHGADAVYIGGPDFGARYNACNTLSDIAKLVMFAHHYHARVFVTLNTILHDNELESARILINQLYESGVDALIIQDMGILELDIPPIELHASTQTDIRSLEKARFLSDVGFSQLVLARELNLAEIKKISDNVDATLEFFIHGALCVAFSGQCYISHAQTGRSANRGDCSQACRLPYTLKDEQGGIISYEKHLLSMKDNNQSANLSALIDAGVRSFKIEGRYKDIGYVKNITAYYRQQLDAIMTQRPEFSPASSGTTEYFFRPLPDKTFHRGSTDYFVKQRKIDIGAFDSPTFVGLPIGTITKIADHSLDVKTDEPLTNGDGLSVQLKQHVVGFRVSQFTEIAPLHYRIQVNEIPAELKTVSLPYPLNRNLDYKWQQSLLKTSSNRQIAMNWCLTGNEHEITLTATSEEGISASITRQHSFSIALQTESCLQKIGQSLNKLGGTLYSAQQVNIDMTPLCFIPVSHLNQLRRDVITLLTEKRVMTFESQRGKRKAVSSPLPIYPETHLTYLANVYNQKAREFYHRFGVTLIDAAYEAHQESGEVPLMITKHCLRFAFNLCPKQARGVTGVKTRATPLQLIHGEEVLTLKFDCKPCEMHVIGKIKPHILRMPPPQQIIASISPEELKKTIPRIAK